jgi:hypothetical protein
MNKFLTQVLWFIGIIFVISLSLVVVGANESRQARFTVDVLEQYLQAYRLVKHQWIESLNQLPDFYLVSPGESLSLRSKDLKQGIKDGYSYDLQYVGNGKFVISASPAGLAPFCPEFGITDKGDLRINRNNTDLEADSYQEVEGWPILPRKEKVRSKVLPEYLK